MPIVPSPLLCISGINRYIVGCKYKCRLWHNGSNRWINRYIVGCKCEIEALKVMELLELIDT